MTEQNTVAIICDLDGTLCPDTTGLLITKIGGKPSKFWRDVDKLVKGGWDPPIAYLTKLLELARNTKTPITKNILEKVGQSVKFFPGALDFVPRLQKMVDANTDFRAANIKFELYIISGGIEEIIKHSAIGTVATAIFGCSFNFDGKGVASGITKTVTFTEKTKFVYAINKGISAEELRHDPYRVNDAMKPEERRVPFEHMIYVGDGPSDIPCFSMVKTFKGSVVGVMPPGEKRFTKPYELAQGERMTIGPYTANYTEDTDLYKMLGRYVHGIADNIMTRRAHTIRPAPKH